MSERAEADAKSLTHLADSERDETPTEKLDRNWNELLQELRVMQTGIQILTGFLLTLPFQPAFKEMNTFQVNLYLLLVVLAAVTTIFMLSSVSMHRVFFRRHIREALVRNTDLILRATLFLVGLVLLGTSALIFDLVLGGQAALVVTLSLGAALLLLWVVLPLFIRSRSADNGGDGVEDDGKEARRTQPSGRSS